MLTTEQIVVYALKRLQESPQNQLAKNMIREALSRESMQKWQTVTKFIQKPPVSQTATAAQDEMANDEPDEKMEEPAQKVMTLEEYENEYNSRLNSEVAIFKQGIEALATVPNLHSFVVDLYREIETPFVSSVSLPDTVDSELKTRLGCL